MNENESLVTISRSRYEELVVAEQDANRLKSLIASKADQYSGIRVEEVKILRDLLMPVTEEDE